jgi:dGTPase
VVETRTQAAQVTRDLFERFMAATDLLPEEWRLAADERAGEAGRARHARRVGDYIAGMTDRYAVHEHRRLFDVTPDLS